MLLRSASDWHSADGRAPFEWAALLVEAGARSVDVVHRHDSPVFAASDWSWVMPLVDRLADGSVRVTLHDGTLLEVDRVFLATGYQPDVADRGGPLRAVPRRRDARRTTGASG